MTARSDTRIYATRAQSIAVRGHACQMAADVMISRPDEPLAGTLWTLALFFESYMTGGAERTHADFGPKKTAPAKGVPTRATLIPILGGKQP